MIEIGSVWRDKDSRMLSGNRRVRVVQFLRGDKHVWYVDVCRPDQKTPYRSKAARFVRAFEKIEEKQ